VRVQSRHLIAYADKTLRDFQRDAGMSRHRLREYLRACVERWRAAYGDAVADAVTAHIKTQWGKK
jgi:hypothetical protein